MKNHIRVLDSDRIQVDTTYGWTENSQICVSLGKFNTIGMSRERAIALIRCLDDVVNASAFDEPIGGPDIDVTMLIQTSEDAEDPLEQFRKSA